METQPCSRCRMQKTAEWFSPSYWGKSGVWCRVCYAAYRRGEPTPERPDLPVQTCSVCKREYRPMQAKTKARYCSRSCKNKFSPARRAVYLVRKYGITADDYETMLIGQGGGCAFCAKRPEDQNRYSTYLHVDHDHETGRVRGLLCGSCNLALGRLGDSPDAIRRVLTYLEAGVFAA